MDLILALCYNINRYCYGGIYLLEENFNFELENLKKDFEIENIQITNNDISLLKRYANKEISFNELVDIVKQSNL